MNLIYLIPVKLCTVSIKTVEIIDANDCTSRNATASFCNAPCNTYMRTLTVKETPKAFLVNMRPIKHDVHVLRLFHFHRIVANRSSRLPSTGVNELLAQINVIYVILHVITIRCK